MRIHILHRRPNMAMEIIKTTDLSDLLDGNDFVSREGAKARRR
jgi:hypothetical protein